MQNTSISLSHHRALTLFFHPLSTKPQNTMNERNRERDASPIRSKKFDIARQPQRDQDQGTCKSCWMRVDGRRCGSCKRHVCHGDCSNLYDCKQCHVYCGGSKTWEDINGLGSCQFTAGCTPIRLCIECAYDHYKNLDFLKQRRALSSPFQYQKLVRHLHKQLQNKQTD